MTLSGGPAVAQEPTDPEAGSPAGVIYEIPIDTARLDAAPRGRGGDAGRGRGSRPGTDRGLRSPIRSENNFGTSSQIPGAEGSSGDGEGAASGSGGGADGTPAGGRSGEGDGARTNGSGHGAGAAGGDGEVAGGAGSGSAGAGSGGGDGAGLSSPSALSPGGVSPEAGLGLLGLVVLFGGYAGLLAARRAG